MTVEINLNDTCEVVLTLRGATMVNKHYDTPHRRKAGEVWGTQIHELFAVFGPACYPSFEPFIEGNQIILTEGR